MASSVPGRFEFLDVVRGAVILHVLNYHAAIAFDEPTVRWAGNFWDPNALPLHASLFNVFGLEVFQGPSLFFVLTGFLLHHSRRRHTSESMPLFLARRASRLYVAYLIALLLFAVVLPWKRIHLHAPFDWFNLLTHLTLTHNLFASTIWGFNGSFWYIATELQLCLLYAVTLVIADRAGWVRAMAVLFCVEVGARVLDTVLELRGSAGMADALGGTPMARSALAYAFTWTLGAAIAESQHRGVLVAPRGWMIGLAATLLLVCTLCRPLSVLSPTAAGLLFAALLAWRVAQPARGSDPRTRQPGALQRALSTIGGISLGIYLLNQPIMDRVTWRMGEYVADPVLRTVLSGMCGALVMIPSAYALCRWIEPPVQRRLQSLIQRLSRPQPARVIQAAGG